MAKYGVEYDGFAALAMKIEELGVSMNEIADKVLEETAPIAAAWKRSEVRTWLTAAHTVRMSALSRPSSRPVSSLKLSPSEHIIIRLLNFPGSIIAVILPELQLYDYPPQGILHSLCYGAYGYSVTVPV